MFYNSKKLRGLYLIRINRYSKKNNQFFPECRVKVWLAGVWYPGESIKNLQKHDSPGSHTPGRLIQRSMIPQGDWLSAVSYPGESNLLGYQIPGSRGTRFCMKSHRGCLPRRVKLTGVAYPGEIDSVQYHTPVTHDPGESTAISLHICIGL